MLPEPSPPRVVSSPPPSPPDVALWSATLCSEHRPCLLPECTYTHTHRVVNNVHTSGRLHKHLLLYRIVYYAHQSGRLVVFTPRSSSELYLEYFLCYVGPEPRSFYWKFTRLTWIQKPGVGRLRPILTESSVCILTCAHLCKDAHG